MTYATTNPPALLVSRVGGSPAIWVYSSADAIATVDGAGYFSNAGDLGMKENDVVFVVDTANNLLTISKLGALSSGAATVIALTAVP
jgi:hypothetical protein